MKALLLIIAGATAIPVAGHLFGASAIGWLIFAAVFFYVLVKGGNP